jgi:putative endonuclease
VKRDDLSCLVTLEPPAPVAECAFVYILACSADALYIGSARDLAVRIAQHGASKGAKFTRDHSGGRLVYFEGPFPTEIAVQRERQLKRWSRAKKLALIKNQAVRLSQLSQSREKRLS